MVTMLAQTAGETAVAGGIFGLIVVLARVAERIYDARKNGKSLENENLPHFRATDRALLGRMAEVCTAKDPTGRPLCYTPPEIIDLLRKQTDILARMEDHLRRQTDTVERRVDVCERHTELLREVERHLKETKP